MLSNFLKYIFMFFLLFNLAFCKIKALFIFSYTLKEKPTLEQYQGTLQALKDYGFEKIEKKVFELDYRHVSQDKFYEEVRDVKDFIKAYDPKVVFIYDDPAFLALLPYVKGKNFYVIFSGINKDIAFYNKKYYLFDQNGYPLTNVVGILEPLFINELITTGIYTFGDSLEYPFLVSNDITGQAVLSEALVYLKDNYNYLKKTSIYTFSYLKNYISFLQSLSKRKDNKFAIDAVFKLKKDDKSFVGVVDLINITTTYYTKPALGFADSWVAKGLTLGVACNFYDMGYKAGVLASNLLQGYPIFFFKVQKEDKKNLVINTKSFEKLKIKIPLSLILGSDKIY